MNARDIIYELVCCSDFIDKAYIYNEVTDQTFEIKKIFTEGGLILFKVGKEVGAGRLNEKDTIDHLEQLIEFCESMIQGSRNDDIWRKDVIALNKAIVALKKTRLPGSMDESINTTP
jgi:hypothetical protein